MHMKKWIKEQFNLRSLDKKIMLISKLIALSIILIYIVSNSYLVNSINGIILTILFIILVMLGLGFLLNRMIVNPIAKLEKIAQKMAVLDFSEYSNLKTNDEFESLGENLNIMADNLQRAIEELEIANKKLEREVERERFLLDQRKELIDQLSHEMKTPLGVIRAYAEGIRDTDDEEKREMYADIVLDASLDMTNLINNLLDLSALEAGSIVLKRECFDFSELVETSIGQLLIDIPNRDYDVECVLPDEKIMVYYDKDRIVQVINNFIVNARKHVITQGLIVVKIIKTEGRIRFSVYNDGIEIDAETGKSIWDKFYKGNNELEKTGSGLGLAIVAQLLKLENLEYGYINTGEGVEFYFYVSEIK